MLCTARTCNLKCTCQVVARRPPLHRKQPLRRAALQHAPRIRERANRHAVPCRDHLLADMPHTHKQDATVRRVLLAAVQLQAVAVVITIIVAPISDKVP